MKAPAIPENESERLNELIDFGILDTNSEEQFDDLVYLAASICDCSTALISLVDSDRQWFKAKTGVDVDETPRDISFCGHAIHSEDLFEVPDTTKDVRFKSNPLVLQDNGIRFYAGQPLVTSKGNIIGTLCVIDDEPKKLNFIQKKQLEILAGQIIVLMELRKKYEDQAVLLRRQSSFVSSMSHEVRTPLTAISGYTDILKNTLIASEDLVIKDSIEALKSTSSHLLDLVGDILDFSKLDASKMIMSNETVELKKILKQVKSVLKISAIQNNVEFKIVQSVATPMYIKTDSTLLKQMLINLASNAIKFSKGGHVVISIDFEQSRSMLSIRVVDDGIGMSESESKNIFNPFVQANAKVKNDFKGTGLGLPITKEISELFGGELKLVKTSPNEGTEFELTFPVNVTSKKRRVKSSLDLSTLDKINKILVLDDVKENRFLLKYYLRDFPIKIDEASNANDFFEKYNDTYDIVLMDMNLPDMHGIDIFKKLKSNSNISKQKFVVFSASSSSDERQEYLREGFSNFVSKPFNLDTLTLGLTQNFNH